MNAPAEAEILNAQIGSLKARLLATLNRRAELEMADVMQICIDAGDNADEIKRWMKSDPVILKLLRKVIEFEDFADERKAL